MPKRKAIKQAPSQSWLSLHGPKLVAALLGTGALGGTTLSYTHADERAAITETKVQRLQEDAGQLAKDIKKMDRRTIRIETQQQLMMEKLGVKQRPIYGPEEQQ